MNNFWKTSILILLWNFPQDPAFLLLRTLIVITASTKEVLKNPSILWQKMLKPLPNSNTHGKYWEFQRTPGPKAFTIFHLSFTLHGERRGSPRRRWRELLPASVFTICSVDPNRMTHDCWVRNIQPYQNVISCHIKPEIIYANMLIL